MAVRQYVGARYVPKFYQNSQNPLSSEWEGNKAYEALTIVTYNNSSYTSKIPVPAGIGNPAQNPTYWAITGNYNAQVEQYRQITVGVQDGLNAEITNRENAEKALKEELDNTINTLDTKLNYFFKTMSLLKASDVKAGDVVKTGGYYTLNDNGGAYYLISETSQGYNEQLNNGLYAVLQNEITTPEMFGAYGDNEHDDSSAIQSAINNSSKVILNASTYKCNNGLSITKPVSCHTYATLNFADAPTANPYVDIPLNGGYIENVTINGKAGWTNVIPSEESEVSGTGLKVNANGLYFNRVSINGCKTGLTFGTHAYNLHFNDLKIYNCWTGIVANAIANADSGENVHFDGGILSANYLAISSIMFELAFNGMSIDYNRKIGEIGTINAGIHSTNVFFNNCFFENRNEAPFNEDYQFTKNGNFNISLVIASCHIGLSTNRLLKTDAFTDKCVLSDNIIFNTNVNPFTAYYCDGPYGTIIAENNATGSSIVEGQFTPISSSQNIADTTLASYVKNVTNGTASSANGVLTLTNGESYSNASTFEIVPLYSVHARAQFLMQAKTDSNTHGIPIRMSALDAQQNTLQTNFAERNIGTNYTNVNQDITIPEGTRYLKVEINVTSAAQNLKMLCQNLRLFLF